MNTADPDVIEWLTFAVVYFDAAMVVHPHHNGWQPVLFPRTLCQGRRLVLEPVKRGRRRKP